MANQEISSVVHQLKQEHIRLCKELDRVDKALSVLSSLDGMEGVPAKSGRKGKKAANAGLAIARPKRRISAAARKKMSDAARARCAAHNAAQNKEKAPAKEKASQK